MEHKFSREAIVVLFLFTFLKCNAGNIIINNNPSASEIVFGNSKIMITLDYKWKCNISSLAVNGQSVISGTEGIFSSIKTSTGTYSTLNLISVP